MHKAADSLNENLPAARIAQLRTYVAGECVERSLEGFAHLRAAGVVCALDAVVRDSVAFLDEADCELTHFAGSKTALFGVTSPASTSAGSLPDRLRRRTCSVTLSTATSSTPCCRAPVPLRDKETGPLITHHRGLGDF